MVLIRTVGRPLAGVAAATALGSNSIEIPIHPPPPSPLSVDSLLPPPSRRLTASGSSVSTGLSLRTDSGWTIPSGSRRSRLFPGSQVTVG
jgi:hypothetical protein